MVRSILMIVVCFMVFTKITFAQSGADIILGQWFTEEDKATVEIYKEGNKYFGKIVALKEPLRNGKPKLDEKNPKPEQRTNPIIGLRFMWNFTYDDDDEWVGGTIYDAESGKEYSCKMYYQKDKTLKVRGYILGMPFLGRSQVWTRNKKNS